MQIRSDHYVYTEHSQEGMVVCVVWADDFTIGGNNEKTVVCNQASDE